jgi:hypothetical protein
LPWTQGTPVGDHMAEGHRDPACISSLYFGRTADNRGERSHVSVHMLHRVKLSRSRPTVPRLFPGQVLIRRHNSILQLKNTKHKLKSVSSFLPIRAQHFLILKSESCQLYFNPPPPHPFSPLFLENVTIIPTFGFLSCRTRKLTSILGMLRRFERMI